MFGFELNSWLEELEKYKKEDTIKIILVKPRCNPEVMEVKNELDVFQNLIGGNIQVTAFEDDHLIVCNEDGMLLELPLNRLATNHDNVILGTFFLTKSYGPEFSSFTQEEIDNLLNKYSLDSTSYITL